MNTRKYEDWELDEDYENIVLDTGIICKYLAYLFHEPKPDWCITDLLNKLPVGQAEKLVECLDGETMLFNAEHLEYVDGSWKFVKSKPLGAQYI